MRIAHRKAKGLFRACLLAPTLFCLPAEAAAPSASDHAVPVPAIVAPPAPIGAEKPVPLEQVTNIKAQPLALLAKFPNAGPQLAQYVAQQVARQPGVVDAILSLANTTSPEQASAIGAGLVRAMRSMDEKQGETYRQVSEKVMRSDNIWLKASYQALGPDYRFYRAYSAPGALPPRDYASFAATDSVPTRDWRVGPAENELVQPVGNAFGNSLIKNNRCRGNLWKNEDRFCHGMIVATVGSNASSNGAVSTSPTL